MFSVDLFLIFKVLGIAILSILLIKYIKSILRAEFKNRPISRKDIKVKTSVYYISIWVTFIAATLVSAAFFSFILASDYFLNVFIILSAFSLPIVLNTLYMKIKRIEKEDNLSNL